MQLRTMGNGCGGFIMQTAIMNSTPNSFEYTLTSRLLHIRRSDWLS